MIDVTLVKNAISKYLVYYNDTIKLNETYEIHFIIPDIKIVNLKTGRMYNLEDNLSCINVDKEMYENLLPEYTVIHELIKKWYDNFIRHEEYYEI